MPIGRCGNHGQERGFTYLSLLIAVASLSIGLAAIGELWSAQAKRERERELLWIGQEYIRAIGSYYYASPSLKKQYPPSLEALLLDSRFVFVRRHLRKNYVDPFTGRAQWGLIPAPGGGIMGVYSLSGLADARTHKFLFLPAY